MKTEVRVPRRTPNDQADIVVFEDDKCRSPYLVVENKADGQNRGNRDQAIEQAFGNANSLRAPFTLYDEGSVSWAFDVANYPAQERQANKLGGRNVLPEQYGNAPEYALIAGSENDIESVSVPDLIQSYSTSPIPLFGLAEDGTLLGHSTNGVSSSSRRSLMSVRPPQGSRDVFRLEQTRQLLLLPQGCTPYSKKAHGKTPAFFPQGTRINLPDTKIFDVVEIIQSISFTTDRCGCHWESV